MNAQRSLFAAAPEGSRSLAGGNTRGIGERFWAPQHIQEAACSTLNGALIGRCRRSLEGSRGTRDGEAQQSTLISGVVEQKASYCMNTQTGLSNDHADP
jgi:hypothetical protein